MELITSVLSIVKNVGEKDREFKLLKEKLTFQIKKGEGTLKKLMNDPHVHTFIRDNLERRLSDAKQKLINLDSLLNSSQQRTISFKDKIKLSLPFNNQRDLTNQTIEELKQAIEEVYNNQLHPEGSMDGKKKLVVEEDIIDRQIEQIYEMGPTIEENNALDFAQQFAKNHTIQVKVELGGKQNILGAIEPANKLTVAEHTCERTSKLEIIELYKLGRLNFKNQYKPLKIAYPDIDKISKLLHFRVVWKRNIRHEEDKSQSQSLQKQQSCKKTSPHTLECPSQKKDEGDQFFSVPDVAEGGEIDNGIVMIQKQKKILYRKTGGSWQKIQQQSFEITNGAEFAVSLNKNGEPELLFKISYRWR